MSKVFYAYGWDAYVESTLDEVQDFGPVDQSDTSPQGRWMAGYMDAKATLGPRKPASSK